MWKFVTRGLRESIERRACRTNVYSQSSQDEAAGASGADAGGNSGSGHRRRPAPSICSNKFLAPCFAAICHGYCGHAKHLGAKDRKSQEKYDANYSWTDAVGLSSILALGYVVCQSLCLRRKLFELDNSHLEKWQNRLLVNPTDQGSRLLGHLLLPRPKYILPISTKPTEPRATSEILFDEVDGPSNVEQPHGLYGPITADQAFKEAADNFSTVHETVMGELELNFGSQAVEEERYEDAIEHFSAGAKLSSAGSMFNLGLCYELGLGTSMNYAKAVKYYKQAADKGHADAMYNLGIFHAQGKGGLKTNLTAARQLFTEAAKKGQVEALKALQLERTIKKRPNVEHNAKYRIDVKTMNHNAGKSLVTTLMSYNFINDSRKSDELTDLYDESLRPKSPTDIFLDMLGVHERSAMPLISAGESGP